MLRLAEYEDFSICLDLFQEVLGVYPLQAMWKDKDAVASLIFSFMGKRPDRAFFLVLNDALDPIGFLMVHKTPLEHTGSEAARIFGLYLKEEYRGKGYMDIMFDTFHSWGKDLHCNYYICNVSKEGADLSKRGYRKAEVMYIKEVE